ncbi:MAG: xanthine dehydrogenase accessory protein XdhC [Steroidobacteraceae bacterium]
MTTTDTMDSAIAGHGAWLQPLQDWPAAIQRALQDESSIARVVVANVRGSAPREAGTCMLVGASHVLGTIGGGTLEWVAIETARALLVDANAPAAKVQRLVLGADLAQCCGGVVDLWIERYTPGDCALLDRVAEAKRQGGGRLVSRQAAQGIERELNWMDSPRLARRSIAPPGDATKVRLNWPGAPRAQDATLIESLDEPLPSLWLYGAGHVGQALARVLTTLPVRTTWIDSRRELLPDELSAAVDMRQADEPELTVRDAPSQTHFIVMTHSHTLDYALCRAILERDDFASVGVIGSKSKAARFRSRLARDGLPRERIANLCCPIGLDGLKSKLPAVIAIAVAAQLLLAIEARSAAHANDAVSFADCDANGAAACVACELLHQAS